MNLLPFVIYVCQVLILDLPENSKKLSKGESVYAVYPDTTAFYPATVSQVRGGGGTGYSSVWSNYERSNYEITFLSNVVQLWLS